MSDLLGMLFLAAFIVAIMSMVFDAAVWRALLGLLCLVIFACIIVWSVMQC